MRQRLPILIACLMIASALLAAGCGGDDENATPAQEGPTSATAATPSAESINASAERNLENCIRAAESLPDETAAAKGKEQCQDSYDNIKEQAKRLDEKTAEAREKCKESAEAIPDGQAKEDALAACDRFQ